MNNAQSYGFDKSIRLVNSKQYSKVLGKGKTQRNPLFVMVSLPNGAQKGRLGITVSKKVSKKAVARNRIKRLIRETYRHCHARLPSEDIVIIARAHAAKADNRLIRETLTKQWAKISSN